MPRAKGYLKVRNLSKYQHYEAKNPSWFKLYTSILDNYEFSGLEDASKYHAIAIIPLAMRTGNHIPNDACWISGKISANAPLDLDSLVSARFLESCDCSSCSLKIPENSCKKLSLEESRGEENRRERGTSAAEAADSTASLSKDFKEAFEAWKRTLPDEARSRVRPTGARRSKYQARRREGYTHQQILDAVTNYIHDPWDGRLSDAKARDFSTLLRDGGQVEKFSTMQSGQGRGRREIPDADYWKRIAAEARQ